MSDSKSTEELRPKVIQILATPSKDGFFKGHTIYTPVVDGLLKLFDQESAKRVEDAENKHRSTLRIIEQFIDRIPEMYAKELLHRMKAFGVEVSDKEIDKEKLDEFLDKTFAGLEKK